MVTVELNGRVPEPAELTRTAYGHFTSMQVRDGRVRGLALHLARLDDGNEAFFGARMDFGDETRVRELIRHALAGTADAAVRVAFVPGAEAGGPPDVLVTVADPVPEQTGPPLRVRSVVHEREWPGQQHLATMGTAYAHRASRRDGYDDALLLGRDSRVREGTSWNVAFWDGTQVIWPDAPALRGVTMVLLQVAMTMAGLPWSIRAVRRGDVPDLLGAAAVSSACPVQPIGSVDDVVFADGSALAETLAAVWKTVPGDEI